VVILRKMTTALSNMTPDARHCFTNAGFFEAQGLQLGLRQAEVSRLA
jgi:hypothetical protein